jgi:hypothetical protein
MNLIKGTAGNDILSNFVDRDDCYTMPPPEAGFRPTKLPKKTVSSKIILQEDSYVEALSKIIERDYFPDTAKLRRHLELLDAYDKNDVATIRALHQQILTEQRRSGSSTPAFSSSSSASMCHQSPCKSVSKDDEGSDEKDSVQIEGLTVDKFFKEYNSEDNESFEILQQRDLEKWKRARHWAYEIRDSEEDGSYEKRPGMLMLYHMGGRVLSVKERVKFDELLELPAAVGDDRPSNPDTWQFRVRNQLMFPPSIEDSQDICRMHDEKSTSTRTRPASNAIEEGDSKSAIASYAYNSDSLIGDTSSSSSSTGTDAAVTALFLSSAKQQIIPNREKARINDNKWVGGAVRQQKQIQRSNTSLRDRPAQAPSSFSSGITPSPLEPPHTPSVYSESNSSASASVNGDFKDRMGRGMSATKRKYKILSMTPSPIPDSAGSSPIMTWGLIGGTPLILDPKERGKVDSSNFSSADYGNSLLSTGIASGAGEGYTGVMYQPPPLQSRDILAHDLAVKGKARKPLASGSNDMTASTKRNTDGSASSSVHRHRSSTGSSRVPVTAATKSQQRQHRAVQLTPAALSLAARLSAGAGARDTSQCGLHSHPFGGSDALSQSYSHSHRDASNQNRKIEGSNSKPRTSSGSSSETTFRVQQSALNTDNLLNF